MTSTALRNNVRLISVVMNASSSTVRNEMTKKLLDYGFSKVKATTLYNANSEITTINIDKAKNENILLYTIDEVKLVYEGTLDDSKITKEVILNENAILPIKANEIIATLRITYNDEVTEYPLIVKEDVEPLSVLELFGKYIIDILF